MFLSSSWNDLKQDKGRSVLWHGSATIYFRGHNKKFGTQLILHTVYHRSGLKVPFRCRKMLHLTSCILFTTCCYVEISIITFTVPRRAEMALYPKEVDTNIKCGYVLWFSDFFFLMWPTQSAALMAVWCEKRITQSINTTIYINSNIPSFIGLDWRCSFLCLGFWTLD